MQHSTCPRSTAQPLAALRLGALRPFITAGVAVMGAGMIAATPVVQDIPQVHLPTVELAAADAANPIQTWLDIVPNTLNNLSALAMDWQAQPFPILSAVDANWEDNYIPTITTALQGSFNAAVQYFTGDQAYASAPWFLNTIWTELMAGDISKALGFYAPLLFTDMIEKPGLPLYPILTIPGEMLQNLTNAYNAAVNEFSLLSIVHSINSAMFGVPLAVLANNLQNAYDASSAGDTLGALSYIVDIPGQLVNGYLNGVPAEFRGMFSATGLLQSSGLVHTLLIKYPELIATAIAPQTAANQSAAAALTSAPVEVVNAVHNAVAGMGPSLDPAAAVNVADFGTMLPAAGALWAELPGLSADILKGFDPAMVTDIAGSLGPSLAADLAGSLGTVAGTLSTDLSAITLDILSAL